MRIIVALVLLLVGCGAASAQGCGSQNPNCIVPTAPVGTADNRAASTAFVQQNVPGFLPTLQPGNALGIPLTGVAGPAASTAFRTALTGGQNFWVNGNSSATAACGATGASTCSAGNDSNNCLTPATACLTLQHVINIIVANVDAAGFGISVFLAHGTSTNYVGVCQAGPILGTTTISIQGDGNAKTAVVIQPLNGGNGVTAKDGCTVGLVNLAFADSVGSTAVAFVQVGTGNYGHLDLTSVTFGTCAVCTAVDVVYSGSVTFVDSGSQVTGNEATVLTADETGVIDFAGNTFAGSANLTFGTAFAVEKRVGAIVGVNASTFTGFSSVTGTRCIIYGLGTIPAVNPNAVYPGNADCVIQTQIGAIALQTGSGGSSAFSFGTAGHALLSGGGTNGKDTWDTAGVSCPSGVTAATVVVVAGIVTHC